MRILICIPHYGNKQLKHLKKVLEEYDHMNFYIDIALFLTEDFDIFGYSRIHIKKFFFNPDIRLMLVHQYKKYMADNVGNYDLFIYSENDILVKETSLEVFINLSEKLKNTRYIPGFLRYEIKNDGYKYLIDYHPLNCTARYGRILMRFFWLKGKIVGNKCVFRKFSLRGKKYFEPYNLHSGFYALTREQFELALKSGNFFKGPKGGYCGTLESAAADIYYRCGLVKIIPQDNIENLLIHHLPDKYVTELAAKYGYNKRKVPDPTKLRLLLNKIQ